MLNNIAAFVKEAFTGGVKERDDYIPTPVRILQELINQPRLAGLMPYNAYMPDEQMFIIDQGGYNDDKKTEGLGFCLEITPQTGANQEMSRVLTSLYSACPAGTGVQFHLFGSPTLLPQLKQYANLRPEDPIDEEAMLRLGRKQRNQNIYRALVRRRIDYYLKGTARSLFRNTPYLLRDYRLVLSVVVPGTADNRNAVDAAMILRDGMQSTLRSANFGSWAWDAEALINWTDKILNAHKLFYDRDDFWQKYDPGKVLRSQVVGRDTVCRVPDDGKSIIFGTSAQQNETAVRSYSVRSYPTSFELWQMGALIGDFNQQALSYPCPFLITEGVTVLDYERSRGAARMKAARATQNADSYMARFMHDMQEQKRDWDSVVKAFDDGRATVKMYHQIMLFAPKKEIERAEQSARAIWRARGFDISSDTYMQIQALQASMPMNLSQAFASDLDKVGRVTTKTTENAVNLSPMLAEWKGTNTPVVQLFGRRGQIMNLDLFENTGGNFNFSCVASSGSGKSVFLEELAISNLGVGAKVWIIDVGKSYEKLCRTLGGEFIEFTPNNTIGLNPFSMVKDLEEEMELLKPLLLQMASTRPEDTKWAGSLVEQAIRRIWREKGNAMTVTDIYALLLTGKIDPDAPEIDQRLRDIATCLYPFTVHGSYGRYFDGPATIDFSRDFVVLELEELKAKKDLQSVVLFIIMYRITQTMYLGDRSRRMLAIIDEAWDIMGSSESGVSASASFVEAGYRRARKYGGAFGTATQNVEDYYKNAAATAAINNADWLFLLRQKAESIELLQKNGRLMMDEFTKRSIMSLRTEHGMFSEVYMHSPLGSGIGRLLLDPFSLLLYSTRAEDYAAINAKRQMGMSVPEAIEAVLADREAGYH